MTSQGKRSAPGPRVAVVGGGIGGLATAAFLHRAGIEATVYEQAPALTEVGATSSFPQRGATAAQPR